MNKILILLACFVFLVGAGNVSADRGLVAEYHFDGNDGTITGKLTPVQVLIKEGYL